MYDAWGRRRVGAGPEECDISLCGIIKRYISSQPLTASLSLMLETTELCCSNLWDGYMLAGAAFRISIEEWKVLPPTIRRPWELQDLEISGMC